MKFLLALFFHTFYNQNCKDSKYSFENKKGAIHMKNYQTKLISLNGNRKLINAVKKAELGTVNPQGDWNGYGYEKLPLHVVINSLSEMRKFNKIKNELEGKTESKSTQSEEEKILTWAKRLVKLTEISLDEALEIANEKLQYKEKQIRELESRQSEHDSAKRQKLINKIERSNPLRRIEDKTHAIAILAASKRHKSSNYEDNLEEGRDLAAIGEIDKSEVKEYAHRNIKYYDDER